MNHSEFELFKTVEQGTPRNITLTQNDFASDCRSFSKTLLYGYDCDRNTHHVYQDFHGLIYLYVYKDGPVIGQPTEIKKIDVSEVGVPTLQDLIPNKRLYPQYCDYEFCAYLKGRGVELPFTTWEDPRPLSGVFVGEIF